MSLSDNTDSLRAVLDSVKALSGSGGTAEVWTFTLEDGSIVEKEVYVGETIVTPPPAPSNYTFYIDSRELHADPDMLWGDWVNSEYNTIGAESWGLGAAGVEAPRDGVLGTGSVCYQDGIPVYTDEAIVDSYIYVVH